MKNYIGRFCDTVCLVWDFGCFLLFIAGCFFLKEEISND